VTHKDPRIHHRIHRLKINLQYIEKVQIDKSKLKAAHDN
jgi:hypothetical protein